MENKYQAFCVRCRSKVDVKDPRVVTMENKKGKRRAVKGTCPDCETKLNCFIKKE